MDSIDEIKDTSKKTKFMNAMKSTYNVSCAATESTYKASRFVVGSTYNASKIVGNASTQFAKNHPYIAGGVISTGAVISAPLLLPLFGFTSSGIAAGSIASTAMGTLGSGSAFIGACQAIGATGSLLVSGTTGATAALTAVAGTVAIGNVIEKFKAKNQLVLVAPLQSKL